MKKKRLFFEELEKEIGHFISSKEAAIFKGSGMPPTTVS